MAEKARKHKLKFRPHFKTHQSQTIGEWFKEEGVDAITVSSLGMANYFAESGWKEITIAMPVNLNALDEISKLSSGVKLNILVDTIEAVEALKKDNRRYNIYIEVDSGANRSGIRYNNEPELSAVFNAINDSDNLNLIGFYSHAGNTYGASSKEEVKRVGEKALKDFLSVRTLLDSTELEFCFGDTPSCSVLDDFYDLQAISPGNFVFYDIMQSVIGSCTLSDIAVHVSTPVLSKKDNNKLLIHGGAIHLSKDNIEFNGRKIFGLVPDMNNAPVVSLSQEHGIVEVNEEHFKNTKIGDHIRILPVHSCLTAQSLGAYYMLNENSEQHEYVDHYANKKP